MATKDLVKVWMLARVLGEEGEVLPARTPQEVSGGFARMLIHGNRAELYDGQDERGKPKKPSGKQKKGEAEE